MGELREARDDAERIALIEESDRNLQERMAAVEHRREARASAEAEAIQSEEVARNAGFNSAVEYAQHLQAMAEQRAWMQKMNQD